MNILEETLFPFTRVREEQKRMLEDVASALKGGGAILAHAPTGIGKTAASLAPALSYALANGKVVFFLTPKHSQHHIAIETLKKIGEKYHREIVAVDMIGKQWTCLFKDARELGHSEFTHFCQAHKRNETCRFCNNVHDPSTKELTKEAKAAAAEIKKKGPLHSEEAFEICKKSDLCPYEVSSLVARSANVVICDYYHLFHPHVRQAILTKMDKSLEDLILVIDEAHNLPERVRRLMSSTLSEYTISSASKEARALREENLEEDTEAIMAALKKLGKKMKGNEAFIKRDELVKEIEDATSMTSEGFIEDLETLGEAVLELPNRYRSFCLSMAGFLRDWTDKKDESAYARILNTYPSQTGRRYQVSINCLDPALYSGEVFSRAYASILMSGTFLPLDMYSAVLGIKSPKEVQYTNPFPPENRLLILTHGITTKYTERSEHMWMRIGVTLNRVMREVPGNVAVFFPSYGILETIRKLIRAEGKEVLVESQEMNKSQRQQLYARLKHLSDSNDGRRGGGGVLLAVQAGSFSEGMDFPGRMLDCVVVVGLPLEKPTLETEALIAYYDFKFGRGWDYGYIYPAMNRALQAAGRCIRSESDRGAIILMDDRFKWQNYAKCFPKDMKFITTEIPEEHVRRFFKL